MAIRSLTFLKHSFSEGIWKCATPLLEAWTSAPPRALAVMSSLVTVLITAGPVTNIWLIASITKIKSVIPGEYTAPPAQFPAIIEICGM